MLSFIDVDLQMFIGVKLHENDYITLMTYK